MSTPDLSSIIPSKWKTYVGLIGSALSFIVPLVISVEDYLPEPWPAVIGGALAVLTALGIYHAPYVPAGTVLAPEQKPGITVTQVGPIAVGGGGGAKVNRTTFGDGSGVARYQNPWKKP